jgi:hypothetical protein
MSYLGFLRELRWSQGGVGEGCAQSPAPRARASLSAFLILSQGALSLQYRS